MRWGEESDVRFSNKKSRASTRITSIFRQCMMRGMKSSSRSQKEYKLVKTINRGSEFSKPSFRETEHIVVMVSARTKKAVDWIL